MVESCATADEAMERYARGDTRAFGTLYDALAPRLHGVLMRRVRDRALVDDLLQKTFLQIHRARGAFVPGAAVFPWAFTIASRLLSNEVRGKRRGVQAVYDEAAMFSAVAPEAAPDRWVEAGELARALEAGLAQLSEAVREAFVLLKIDGLTLAEAAEVLGVTETAVKLRAHRAYEALREVIREHERPTREKSYRGGPSFDETSAPLRSNRKGGL